MRSDLFARHREHAERIMRAQIVFAGERKFAQIVERLQIVGMHAGLVECVLVMRDVIVGVRQRPFQPLELQRGNLVARGDLDRLESLRGAASDRRL